MKRKLMDVCLCLFDEGAGAAAAEVAGETGDVTNAAETKKPSIAGKGKAKNPLAEVQYGKVDEPAKMEVETTQVAAETQEVTALPEDRRAKFEELIKGEYRDEFTSRTQGIIDERFRQMKQLESANEKIQPLINLLGAKYGVADGNVESIVQAVQNDNSLYEQAASDKGMSVEQYKYMLNVEAENKRLNDARQENERRQNAEKVYAGWVKEAETVKTLYPGFDLVTELSNPEFGKLLGSGVGVKAAFQALHHDDIMTGAMQYTAQTVAKKAADNIASRQQRPSEAGLGTGASALVKSDVSKLTKADRAEIAKRAARGEKINF